VKQEWVEKDYYKDLGVDKTASQDEIKKSFRKLAQKLHPDANPDDAAAEKRFKRVSEAYAVVSDEEQRGQYDEMRRLGPSGGFPGGGAGGGFNGKNIRIEDLGDLFGGAGGFGDLFGGGNRRTRPARGHDLQTNIDISFRDSIFGVARKLPLRGDVICDKCKGSGGEPGTGTTICPTCSGAGSTISSGGFFQSQQICQQCSGSGRVVTEPCTQCGGQGTQHKSRTLTIRVPAGVKPGAVIRARGKGAPGAKGGPAGDLLLQVNVKSDPNFGRRGDHITTSVPVAFTDATLGADITVQTLTDSVTLRIPAGTPSESTFRVKGRGVPKKRGKDGDLLVTVNIVVPKKLSRKAKKLLEQFRDEHERIGAGS
jgi:molecular chaperone DnaJ